MHVVVALPYVVKSFYFIVCTIVNVPTHVISICLFLIFYSCSYVLYVYIHSPNGGKYLWYLMNIFSYFVLSFKFFGGESITIKDRQGFSQCQYYRHIIYVYRIQGTYCCQPKNPTNHCTAENGITYYFTAMPINKRQSKLVIFKCGAQSFLCLKHFWNVLMFRLHSEIWC